MSILGWWFGGDVLPNGDGRLVRVGETHNDGGDMSDPYTAAQEAERAARRACTGDGYMGCTCGPHRRLSDATLALCLAAAAACGALSAALTRCDHDGLYQTRSDIAQAIADDYAARAVAWRKAGGET